MAVICTSILYTNGSGTIQPNLYVYLGTVISPILHFLYPKYLLHPFPREPLCLPLQHLRYLSPSHVHLLANRYQTICKVEIVFAQQAICDHQEVDVVEDERAAIGILLLDGEESSRVISPVPAWVKVVGGMPAVVEAIAVGLWCKEVSQISKRMVE